VIAIRLSCWSSSFLEMCFDVAALRDVCIIVPTSVSVSSSLKILTILTYTSSTVHQTQFLLGNLTSRKATPPRPTFKRDDVPHKGLNPLPERRRPRVVKVSRVEHPVQRRDEKKESRQLDRHSTTKPQTFERRNPSPSFGTDNLAIDEFFCPSESVTVSSSAKGQKTLGSVRLHSLHLHYFPVYWRL